MAGYSLLNSSAVRELASLVLFENIVQEVMVIPGRSADFRYVTDINAKTVTVNRVKLVNGGREIGATTMVAGSIPVMVQQKVNYLIYHYNMCLINQSKLHKCKMI